MDLALTPDQRGLVTALESLLATRRSTTRWDELVETAPGYDTGLWSELIDRRLVTVGFPEDLGGGGGAVSEMVLVAEALGGAPTPGPLHSGIVWSGLALRACGDDARLRSLLSGDRTFTFCSWDGGGGRIVGGGGGVGGIDRSDRSEVVATRTSTGWRLEGQARFVPYGADVDELLVLATIADDDSDGAAGDGAAVDALFAVAGTTGGVAMDPVRAIGGDRMCHVTFGAVDAEPSAMVGEIGLSESWLPLVIATGRVVAAAEMVGAASAALAHASAWARTRVQFKSPIGTQQAVQHRLADAYIDLVTARDAVYDAAAIIDRGEVAGVVAAAGAKAYCSDACRRVTAAAHQVCGGEGIYADQPLHAWHRRVHGVVPLLGGVQILRAAVAESVLDT